MKEDTLGSSEAARRLTQMHSEGSITTSHWRKISRAYNHFCYVTNEIWTSSIEERTKRGLFQLVFSNAIQKTHLMNLPYPIDAYLRNVLTTHHKEISAKFKTQRYIKRGMGNRTYR